MDDLKRITKYEKVENFISNLANETLLIYSPTSLKKTIIDDKININLISTTELTKNVYILDEKIKEFPNNINLIVQTPTFMKLLLLNKEFNSLNYPHLKCLYF